MNWSHCSSHGFRFLRISLKFYRPSSPRPSRLRRRRRHCLYFRERISILRPRESLEFFEERERERGVRLPTRGSTVGHCVSSRKGEDDDLETVDQRIWSPARWKQRGAVEVVLPGDCKPNEIDLTMPIRKPPCLQPLPVIVPHHSPASLTELDAAATTIQNFYKSHRTRRNLADCAVVVEELWWKALDFAALKRSSVSFFNMEKTETAVSKWSRARTRAAKVGKGLSRDEKAQKLALQHWLEAIDPRHRYGHNLHFYYDHWSASRSTQPFFYWLDVGDGRDVNLEVCCRAVLHQQCIKYLGPKERREYEVVVESGKLVYRQSGVLVNTAEDSKWIFVLSTSRALYVGKKKKGLFQHSSFLSGGATAAAGRLVVHGGVLEAIWPYSGHYLPTEENFKEFIGFLEEKGVGLANVKRCGIDDESSSAGSEEMKPEEANAADGDEQLHIQLLVSNQKDDGVTMNTDSGMEEDNAQILDTPRRLACKWTSGVGARIGCVKEYPTELQWLAMEQVNLTPEPTPRRYLPIPSPRPSPFIRVSPRLAYMGLPSPRVSFTPSA